MKKKVAVIMHPEIERALKGYVPEMGNEDDLRIVKDLEKLHRKLASIDSATFRDIQASKRRQGELTSKMREIQSEEQYLIKRIINRNLDF